MTTTDLMNEIKESFGEIHNVLKNEAPQNSTYISNLRGKLVPFIFVDGKRVYRNTGNLFNNVAMSIQDSDKLTISRVYVSSVAVPYYEKAILRPNIVYARHYGRSEYGDVRYSDSVVKTKKNDNYLYYLRTKENVRTIISKYDGRTIRVTDDIGKFR